MSDLIDRDEVIEIIESVCSADDTYWQPGALEKIRNLPTHTTPSNTLGALESIQTTQLTDEDKETIRIHLNAFKESLCNQGRWYEATEYEELIHRLLSTSSVQPEIIRCMGCKYYMQTDTLHHRGWCRWWNHFTAIERYCSEGIER